MKNKLITIDDAMDSTFRDELKMILYKRFMELLPDSEFKAIHAEENADNIIASIMNPGIKIKLHTK